jgi:hypothetical protein
VSDFRGTVHVSTAVLLYAVCNYSLVHIMLKAYLMNYTRMIDLQNEFVIEYHELNKQAGDTWFIVPR